MLVVSAFQNVLRNQMSKKKRIHHETRTFRKKWTETFCFVEHEEKIMCMICKHKVAVINDYRLMLPY